MDDLKSSYVDEDWDKVKSIAKYLNAHFKNSKEDLEAQELVATIGKNEDEIVVRNREEDKNLNTNNSSILDTIQILDLYASRPNTAHGVDLYLKIKNNSNKTIKYFDIWVEAVNRVGDPATCSITNESEFGGRCTGPIPSGGMEDGYFSNAWYNNTIGWLEINGIDIEYMDGSKISYDKEESQIALKFDERYVSSDNKNSSYKFGNVNSPKIVDTYQYITSSTANVRSGPGFKYGIIDELFNGDKVYVYEISYANDRYWCRIGANRWISIRLLDGTID